MVIAYPVAGKAKSLDICRAFVAGCGGVVAHKAAQLDGDAPAFFYGVDASNVHIWEQVRREGRDFYYCDNSYFDATRQTYFRVTKNRIQHSGEGWSTGERFAALNIPVELTRHEPNGHIVLCPQSDWFMRAIADYGAEPSAWLRDAQAHFRSFAPEHPQRVRHWEPDKAKLARSLPDDLVGAWALVTHSSAAAVTALLSGVPVFCAPESAAYPLSSFINEDERPALVHWEERSRREWAGVLADNQWTLEEMKYGQCWADLQQKEAL